MAKWRNDKNSAAFVLQKVAHLLKDASSPRDISSQRVSMKHYQSAAQPLKQMQQSVGACHQPPAMQPCSMAKTMTGVRHLDYFVRCGNCHASPMAKSSPMTVSEWPWQTRDAKRFSNFIRYDWSSGAGAPQTPCVSTSSHLHLQCSQTFSRKSIEPLSHWTNGDQPNLRLFNVSKRKNSSGIPDKRRVLSVEQVQNLGPWRPYRPTKNLFPKLITLISPSIKDAAGYQSNQPGNHPVGGCANVSSSHESSQLWTVAIANRPRLWRHRYVWDH